LGAREPVRCLDYRTCEGDGWMLVNVAGRVREGLLNSIVHKTGYCGCIP
jgi:hypothetical protein